MSENNLISNVKIRYATYEGSLIAERGIFKKASQKLCYLYIVSFSNANKIFPSMDSIAEAICSNKKTATVVIQELEELGLISVKRTTGLPNIYTINDYDEVVGKNNTSVKITPPDVEITPVQKLHQSGKESNEINTSVKITPVQKLHSTNSSLKDISNNSNSTTTNTIESIDEELKKQFPNVPFEEVKAKVLHDIEYDASVDVRTLNQYKGFLRSRLGRWTPSPFGKSSFNKKPIRTEHQGAIDNLLNTKHVTPEATPETEAKMKALQERLKKYKKPEGVANNG